MQARSREQFVDSCLRKLGAPVIDINIDPEQIDDCVDEALGYMIERHYGGVERTHVKYQLTQEDIDNQYIVLSDNILTVVSVLKPARSGMGATFMNDIWHMQRDMAYGIAFTTGAAGSGFLTNYWLTMNYYNEFNNMLRAALPIHNFNHYTGRLLLEVDWAKTFTAEDWILMDTYLAVDPNVYTKLWGSRWLRKYGTALMGIQWGSNLSKFDGIQLPGGLTLDGDKIYERYLAEKTALEEEFSSEHELPVDFFVG